jgi:hypothetical protein
MISVSAGRVAGNHDARSGLLRSVPLPSVAEVNGLAPAELPPFIVQLAALLTAAAMRMRAAITSDGDDCDAFDVEEAARRLTVSVDLLRERGIEWGAALVLTRDKQGRATRVIYPRARLRAFLEGRPATTKSAA